MCWVNSMAYQLQEISRKTDLAEKLNKFDSIKKFDSEGEPEAYRLVHSLSDLEASFQRISDDFIPSLLVSDNEDDCYEALLDIADELRHVLYHIQDPNFFSHLREEVPVKSSAEES